MTLDAEIPKNDDYISTYAEILRETRSTVNDILGSIDATAIQISKILNLTGSALLYVGTNDTQISDIQIEILLMQASSDQNITDIKGCKEGYIKLFLLMSDKNITFVNNESKIRLNGEMNFTMGLNDSICFVNKDGNGIDDDGYWIETFRNIRG